MRVEVKKFLVFGPKSQQKAFFKKAQQLGTMEFIDHGGSKLDVIPENVKNMNRALKILRGFPPQTQHSFENSAEAGHIAEEILRNRDHLNALGEEKRYVRHESARVAVFGNFSREDIQFIHEKGGRKVRFFFAKNRENIPESPDLIFVGKDHELYYFVSFGKGEEEYQGLIEMKVERSYGELAERQKEIEEEIREAEIRIKELAAYRNLIREAVILELNHYNLQVSRSFVEYHWEESFFSAEVWIAKPETEKTLQMIDEFSLYATEIAPNKDEVIPTHLENTGFSKIGEDLVYVYDTPSNQDKDPSGWVLWAFTFFFSFIIGDGGYGVILLFFALLLRRKIKNPAPFLGRFLRLTTILSIGCILWGLATASFFGLQLPLQNAVKKYSLLTYLVEKKAAYHISREDSGYREFSETFPHLQNVRDPKTFLDRGTIQEGGKSVYVIYDSYADSIMLEMSLLIGVLHLVSSMFLNVKRHWAGLGWVLFLIGGYLYFPKVLEASSIIHFVLGVNPVIGAVWGLNILWGGIGLAVILALIQNRLGGIGEITNVIQVFADVLSYMRLYALALAGAMMAKTFNGFAGGNLILSILILLAGHSINLGLSVMSGVIHGLRLNFLEWYHFCFDGGGKRHQPLSLIELRN